MCGIFGWVSPEKIDRSQISKSIGSCFDSLRYRGPDDKGFLSRYDSKWTDNHLLDSSNILLGQVRLSVIDLTDNGHQPMVSDNGRYRLIYNGEIYNYKELRNQLRSEGVVFRTETDTEVVLQVLSHWGIESITKFNGMFAIAWHDDFEDKLYLIRDYFGIKPLFYTRTQNNIFAFASELPALLKLPDVNRKINAQKAYNYLVYGDYDSSDMTFIEGVYHVNPGEYCVIDTKNGTEIDKISFWKPTIKPVSTLSYNESVDCLRDIFLNNIKLHLRSDAPLGAALSGGVDSSAVVAAIRYLEPDFKLNTFTYVASNHEADEEQWADLVINHCDLISHKVRLTSHEMLYDLDDLIQTQGEPFGSTSIYAQYRVFKLAKEMGMTVTLDGQGADELLAGYFGFPGERLKSLIYKGNISKAWDFLNSASRLPGRSKSMILKRFLGAMIPDILYNLAWHIGQHSVKPDWINLTFLNDNNVKLSVPIYDSNVSESRYVHSALIRQISKNGLPGLLRHSDRNSMRFSIESRVPFLTKELCEFSLSLPEEYLIDEFGNTKSIFKQAMKGIVPDQILNRKDKVGFVTPEKELLFQLEPWIKDTLSEAGQIPIFNTKSLYRYWDDYQNGNRKFDWQVWRWMNFIRWSIIFNVKYS